MIFGTKGFERHRWSGLSKRRDPVRNKLAKFVAVFGLLAAVGSFTAATHAEAATCWKCTGGWCCR